MKRVIAIIGVAVCTLPPAVAQAPLQEQVHVGLDATGENLVIHWAVQSAPDLAAEPRTVLWSQAGMSQTTTPGALAGVHEPHAVQDGAANAGRNTYIYSATIGPLTPGGEIAYWVGTDGAGHRGPFDTRAPPAPHDGLRFVAYGDIGTHGVAVGTEPEDPNSAIVAVRQLALAQDPDLVVIPGDLAYDNRRSGWDRFQIFMEPLASKHPVMPVIGNHEFREQAGDYAPFLSRFVLPNDEHDFTFSTGGVAFIAMDSDRICGGTYRTSYGTLDDPCEDLAERTESSRYLEDALAQARSEDPNWLVVYHHHPAHSWGRHGDDFAVRSFWVPLYERYGVDLVITAHDHLYSRTHALRDGAVVDAGNDGIYASAQAPIYVVVGGGGRDTYNVPAEPAPPWVAAAESVHHLLKVETNSTALVATALRASDASVLDRFEIQKLQSTQDGSEATADSPGLAVATAVAVVALVTLIRRRG